MFSRTDKSRPVKPAPEIIKVAPSIISSNLHIVGNLMGEGDIQIDGRVEGDIKTKSLTIGESALVIGEILAEEISIRGRVEGLIRGRIVRLFKTAQVTGDILHEAISIEQGAMIEGQVKRADKMRDQIEPKVEAVARPAAVAVAG